MQNQWNRRRPAYHQSKTQKATTFLVGPFNGSGNRTRRRHEPESHRVVSAPVEPDFSPHLVRPRTLLARRRSTTAAQPNPEPIGPSQPHVRQLPLFPRLLLPGPILVLDPTRTRHGQSGGVSVFDLHAAF
ncbi:hypothetical protein TB2_013657 [Malus domestica]